MHDLQNWRDTLGHDYRHPATRYRDVPAEICDDCGEYYLSAPIATRVYTDADATAKRHVEVDIQRYAA